MKSLTGKSGSNVKSAARLSVEAALRQARRPLTMTEIIARAGLTGPRARIQVENYLRAMVLAGTARRMAGDIPAWAAGRDGERPRMLPSRMPWAEPYVPVELRPFDGRPGAMDAFTLPSRAGNRRVWRDGRVEVAG